MKKFKSQFVFNVQKFLNVWAFHYYNNIYIEFKNLKQAELKQIF
jgi:hypothetical protein